MWARAAPAALFGFTVCARGRFTLTPPLGSSVDQRVHGLTPHYLGTLYSFQRIDRFGFSNEPADMKPCFLYDHIRAISTIFQSDPNYSINVNYARTINLEGTFWAGSDSDCVTLPNNLNVLSSVPAAIHKVYPSGHGIHRGNFGHYSGDTSDVFEGRRAFLMPKIAIQDASDFAFDEMEVGPRPTTGCVGCLQGSVGRFLSRICDSGGYPQGPPHVFRLGSQPSPSEYPEAKRGDGEKPRQNIKPKRVISDPFIGAFPSILGALLGVWFLYFIGVIPREPYRKNRER
jgi:hypothetical protein